MKSVISLLVFLFSVLNLIGQVNYNPNRKTNGEENIEDIQLTETGNYMLGSYTNVKANKYHHDSLVVYVLDENLKEESRKVIKTGFEADLGVSIVGFANDGWLLLTCNINKQKNVFEYNLIKLSVEGDFNSTYTWGIPTATYDKTRKFSYARFVRSGYGVTFGQNKDGFSVSIIINNKRIKNVFIDNNGGLINESDVRLVSGEMKFSVMDNVFFYDSMLDENGYLYFILGSLKNTFFYCSMINGELNSKKVSYRGKSVASVNLLKLNNKVSCLTTYTKKTRAIKDSPDWELFNFDDNVSDIINVNNKSCNSLDYIASSHVKKYDEIIFISSGKLEKTAGEVDLNFCIDLSVFSLKKGSIVNSTLIKRKVLGSPSNEYSFKGRIWSLDDGCFVIYKDIPVIKPFKSIREQKEETIGVKLDSNLQVIESKTMGERVAYENFSLVKKYQGKLWVPVLEGGSYMFIPID